MVLVTGGAGLVGKELISQLLTKGKKVRAIYNRNFPVVNDSALEQLQCSILDVIGLEEAMNGIEEVYHCAGLVSFDKGNVKQLYKVNVEGTANVVDAALEAGIRKLVHVSSVAALGRLRNGELVTEKMQWTESTSNSNYGQSKYLGEMEVWRGMAEGLNAVIVNPPIILGSGNWDEGSTGIFKSVYNEFPWYTEGVSGFVDVRDVVAAMIMLMDSDVSGERFIVSGANVSYRELFNKIAVCFNKKPPAKKATPFLASLVRRMESMRSSLTSHRSLVTKETIATSFAKVRYDNSKLLSFFPTFNFRSLDDTVKDTCNSLQQKINNL